VQSVADIAVDRGCEQLHQRLVAAELLDVRGQPAKQLVRQRRALVGEGDRQVRHARRDRGNLTIAVGRFCPHPRNIARSTDVGVNQMLTIHNGQITRAWGREDTAASDDSDCRPSNCSKWRLVFRLIEGEAFARVCRVTVGAGPFLRLLWEPS
jgi:hypothetical protein